MLPDCSHVRAWLTNPPIPGCLEAILRVARVIQLLCFVRVSSAAAAVPACSDGQGDRTRTANTRRSACCIILHIRVYIHTDTLARRRLTSTHQLTSGTCVGDGPCLLVGQGRGRKLCRASGVQARAMAQATAAPGLSQRRCQLAPGGHRCSAASTEWPRRHARCPTRCFEANPGWA